MSSLTRKTPSSNPSLFSEELEISRQGTRNLMRKHGVCVVTAAKKQRMLRNYVGAFFSKVLQTTKVQ